ncbi:carbon starvation CstA family protein, partial [Bacillus paralicheniformis]|uniref:carbon starvation CstA family protein n=1 Tax=Bacillus paralicheniformis TaxID=1648923 RepID=UPI00289702B1
MKTLKSILRWGVITAVGAGAFGVIALSQGETINAVWLLVASVCEYAVAYRFYSRFIVRKVFNFNDNRQTP